MKKSILIGWTEPYRQKFNISNTYTFSVWCWFLHASALHGHLLDWCGHAFCAYQMYVVKCHPHISIENSNMKFTNFFVDFFYCTPCDWWSWKCVWVRCVYEWVFLFNFFFVFRFQGHFPNIMKEKLSICGRLFIIGLSVEMMKKIELWSGTREVGTKNNR